MYTCMHNLGRIPDTSLFVGILDTPFFPRRYYAGCFRVEEGEPIPCDNSTGYYHMTVREAQKNLNLKGK
jgi:hypothetical protein